MISSPIQFELIKEWNVLPCSITGSYLFNHVCQSCSSRFVFINYFRFRIWKMKISVNLLIWKHLKQIISFQYFILQIRYSLYCYLICYMFLCCISSNWGAVFACYHYSSSFQFKVVGHLQVNSNVTWYYITLLQSVGIEIVAPELLHLLT